jgi:type II secretory pathway pseudopilin PulG
VSGKRIVAILIGLAIAAAVIAWFGAARVEERNRARKQDAAAAAVLSEGVLYEALAGDPGLVVAKDVGSGKELWRAELGAVTTKPVVLVRERIIEIQIAGTPWMTLDKSSGEPVER